MQWIKLTKTDGNDVVVNAAQIAFIQEAQNDQDGLFTVIFFAAARGDGSLTLSVRDAPAEITSASAGDRYKSTRPGR